jgi:Spx/MgsR family transcriptional regulator
MYGIRNCDTVRKARAWLEAQGIDYEFHDFQRSGVERELLERWCRELGWERVLNRAGTSFRKLAEADKQDLDADKAIDLMLAQPSMIKRPVLRTGRRWVIGFAPERYAEVLKAR